MHFSNTSVTQHFYYIGLLFREYVLGIDYFVCVILGGSILKTRRSNISKTIEDSVVIDKGTKTMSLFNIKYQKIIMIILDNEEYKSLLL